MSDDADVEQLLDNFQKALDTLGNIENVEALITKLDANKNRKLLKRVKSVVSEVHTKVGGIKEKVSRAYKKVKIRSTSESDDVSGSNIEEKDTSVQDEDSLNPSTDPLDLGESEERCSPVLDGKGRHLRRNKSSKNKNGSVDDVSDKQSQNSKDNNDEMSLVDGDVPMNLDDAGTESNDQLNKKDQDTQNKSNETSDVEKNNEGASSEDMIEGTPERTVKKLTISLNKTKNRSVNDKRNRDKSVAENTSKSSDKIHNNVDDDFSITDIDDDNSKSKEKDSAIDNSDHEPKDKTSEKSLNEKDDQNTGENEQEKNLVSDSDDEALDKTGKKQNQKNGKDENDKSISEVEPGDTTTKKSSSKSKDKKKITKDASDEEKIHDDSDNNTSDEETVSKKNSGKKSKNIRDTEKKNKSADDSKENKLVVSNDEDSEMGDKTMQSKKVSLDSDKNSDSDLSDDASKSKKSKKKSKTSKQKEKKSKAKKDANSDDSSDEASETEEETKKSKSSGGKKDSSDSDKSSNIDLSDDSSKTKNTNKKKKTKCKEKEKKAADSNDDEESENTSKKSLKEKDILSDDNPNDSVVSIMDTPKKPSSKSNTDAEPDLSAETEGKTEEDKENIEVPLVPKIKLVDISKLLAPNTKPMEAMTPSPRAKKSVTFDSSVIILSSSDEDTPKKDPKNKNQSPLKSAMRKSTSKEENNTSDSDSEENRKSKRRSERNKKKTEETSSDDSDFEETRKSRRVKKSSSDESDFDGTRKSRRLKKTETDLKSKFSDLKKKVRERKNRVVERRSSRNKDDNSSDEERSNRKKKNKDKKLISESEEDDSDNERTNVKNNKRKKQHKNKELLETSSLSEHSDNSDLSDLEETTGSRTKSAKSRPKSKRAKVYPEPDINDPQFKSKVYIRLPLFKCEELPDVYKRKKEIFEVKKLTKMDFTRRTRSARNGPTTKNSDDSADKPETKRIKLTLKLNKRDREKTKEDSSDGERSSTEDNDDVAKEKEANGKKKSKKKDRDEEGVREDVDAVMSGMDNGVAEGDTELAKECLEQIKDASDKEEENDKEKDKSDSDSDEKPDKKNKKKTKKGKDDNDEESTKEKESNKKDKDKEPKVNGVLSDSEEESNNKKDKKDKDSDDESSDKDDKTEKKKAKKADKLLTEKLDSSDSDDFSKFSKKKDKDLARKTKKRMKKAVVSDSDSDEEAGKKKKKGKGSDDDDDYKSEDKSSNSEEDSDKEKKESDSEDEDKKKPARKRIKRVKDSSSDDEDHSTRKQIRKMIDRDSLSAKTKKAEEQEKMRKARIAEKQRKYNQIFQLKADATVDKVVLDFDEKTDEPLLSVHKKLVKQLKPHQVQGVKFMWDACFESLERMKKSGGSGCILAHCMGLGKTLQVIALAHTLLTHSKKTKVEKVLVVCPVNTVLNWKSEFKKWSPKDTEFEVYELVSCKTSSVNHERNYIVREWHENGGVLIIGYNMFRNLSNPDNKAISKKLRTSFQEGLVDPGPDLVVCDEGHLLKNEKTHLSIAMNRIKTPRRIVLTGTPLQNNLKEYWCMVQFIKPNLLGTYKEYMNRFVNPIINGQYTDSTQHDIVVMRRRAHVLHKLLDGVVQRQDYSVLEPYLPPKYEYVIFLKLTEVQGKLYQHYLEHFARKNDGSNRTSFLFTDFQQFQRICTHPRVLLDKSIEDKEKKDMNEDSDSEGSLKDFIDDDSEAAESTPSDSSSDNGSNSGDSVKSNPKKKKKMKLNPASKRTRMTRAQAAENRKNGEESDNEVELLAPKQWWEEYIEKDELDNINHSAKIFLLFEILKECEEIGDKILVFSQSLYALNCIEYFLQRIDEATQRGETEKVGGHSGSWAIGLDYFRLDGSSSCDNRASWCDQFNDPDNTRARLFLISTKAGGLGINLVAANRVIIFDVSWNPSHDIQSIYRVYRFGQTKPSYVYRFVTYGAMEMKIYERQVTKQAISKRVIDEQQIDRHYSQNDIQELYKTDLDPQDRPIPLVPKDVLLGEMVQKYDKTIFKYHEHQSLLENKQDEELNEEERKAAWDEFENEKVLRRTAVTSFGGMNLTAFQNSLNFSPQLIQLALANIVRKDNPAWSEVQIKGILPALVAQLQMQMSENDFSMYNRVHQEVRLMQAIQAQRMRENYLKQYQLQQMLQKQQISNQLLGNMKISAEDLRRLQMGASQNYIQPQPQPLAPTNKPGGSGDVIELND